MHRRGVGAQQYLVVDVEGVLHVPGGVVPGHIEGLEVVVIELDLRPLGEVKSHAEENLDDAPVDLRDGVHPPRIPPPAG
jgi:hypothetical protein